VAGTVAQSTNNGSGVAGVAYGATLMPVKVLDGQWAGQLRHHRPAASSTPADRGAKVINIESQRKGGLECPAEAVDLCHTQGRAGHRRRRQ